MAPYKTPKANLPATRDRAVCTGSTDWTTAEVDAKSETRARRLRKEGVNLAKRSPVEIADRIEREASLAVPARLRPDDDQGDDDRPRRTGR